MDSTIVNKVATSGLITINLAHFTPNEDELAVFDIAPFLFKGLILREKDFREALPANDWTSYQNKKVAVYCSADAIVPMWAFMLIVNYLSPICDSVFYGDLTQLKHYLTIQNIEQINAEEYQGKLIVVKGCEDMTITPGAFLAITAKLEPVVQSLMYGEPCSTVPIYKKKKQTI